MQVRLTQQLQHRLQQCIHLYPSLQKSVDQTYSRINEQNSIVDMGRFDNLLHYTFKEIQWAKSSRMMAGTNRINTSVERHENDLSRFEYKTKQMEKQYNEVFQSLQDRIEAELHQITEKEVLGHHQSMSIFDSLEQSLQKAELELDKHFQQLESELYGSNAACVSILSARIGSIQHQISQLFPAPSNPK